MEVKEEWRDIAGYEGLYQVSNLGKVKCFVSNKLRKPQNQGGYLQIQLNKSGRRKWLRVHRIVAQAFIPNPENKPEIDHIDGNPQNNSVDNLRWATSKENSNNPIAVQKIRESLFGNTGILSRRVKPIICIEKGVLYWGVWEAQRQTGVFGQNINAVCRGRAKTAGGYHWRYATPEEIKEVL